MVTVIAMTMTVGEVGQAKDKPCTACSSIRSCLAEHVNSHSHREHGRFDWAGHPDGNVHTRRCGRPDTAGALAVVVRPAASPGVRPACCRVLALVAVAGVAVAAQHRRDGTVAADERRVVGVDVRQLARDAIPDHPLRRGLRDSWKCHGKSPAICSQLKEACVRCSLKAVARAAAGCILGAIASQGNPED